jgi:hypothetical protein
VHLQLTALSSDGHRGQNRFSSSFCHSTAVLAADLVLYAWSRAPTCSYAAVWLVPATWCDNRGSISVGGELGISVGPVGRAASTDVRAGDAGIAAAFSYAHSKVRH